MWRFHNIVAMQMQGGAAPRVAPVRDCTDGDWAGALAAAMEGDRLRMAGLTALPDELRRLFVEIDHREIGVYYPDAPVMDAARQVPVFEAARGEVVLEKGPNDYPSNFAFDVDQPRARVVLEAMREELARAPSERGFQVLGGLANQAGWAEGLAHAAAGLRALDAQEVLSFNLILRAETDSGDMARRKALLVRAVGCHPGERSFAIPLCNLLAQEGEVEAAEAVLREAIAAGSDSGEIRDRLAGLCLRQRRFDDARTEAELATRLDPSRPMGWYALVRAELSLGHGDAAEAACLRALERCGAEPELLILQAQARLAQGNPDGAAQCLDAAAAQAPDHPRITDLRARIKAG
jgi:predicted Zn-dependent protease